MASIFMTFAHLWGQEMEDPNLIFGTFEKPDA